jgi:hypothetical protein
MNAIIFDTGLFISILIYFIVNENISKNIFVSIFFPYKMNFYELLTKKWELLCKANSGLFNFCKMKFINLFIIFFELGT